MLQHMYACNTHVHTHKHGTIKHMFILWLYQYTHKMSHQITTYNYMKHLGSPQVWSFTKETKSIPIPLHHQGRPQPKLCK